MMIAFMIVLGILFLGVFVLLMLSTGMFDDILIRYEKVRKARNAWKEDDRR